jgi:hypothetical protein
VSHLVLRGFLVLLCSLTIHGCSKSNDRAVAVYPVDGQLFVGGQPAVEAVVVFHPTVSEANAVVVTAEVGLNGHFIATQPDGAAGLPEGDYRLTATWPDGDGDTDRFNGKYSDPEQPLMEISVKPTINLLPPIRLK